MRRICLLVFVLQLGTLFWLVDGYQLADSVEYMDRAYRVVRGESLDPGTVRSFAFSALLTPVFAVSRLLGLEHQGPAVFLTRLMQMAIGLLAVVTTVRIGARLFGRPAGLAAGLFLGLNPIFLQWTVEPLADPAAMLFVALALLSMLAPGGFRRGLVTGLWLGAALLMAFKTIMIGGLFLVFLLLRHRRRGRLRYAGVLAGFSACLLVQCLLDLRVYGSFGSSIWTYVVQNFAGTFVSWSIDVGQATGITPLRDFGVWLYKQAFDPENAISSTFRGELKSMHGRTWYLEHLHTGLLAWPVLACGALGLVRAARRPSWPLSIAALTVIASVAVMSRKGDQSFRLWLTFLPLVAVLAGGGWGWMRGADPAAPLRRGLAAMVLVVGCCLGLGILRGVNCAKYAGYWRAMKSVNAATIEAAERGEEPLRVSSGLHWAVRFREAPEVELRKLPFPLYEWPRLDAEQRAAVLAELRTLDRFIAHRQLIDQDPALMEVINRHFEVVKLIFDPHTFEELLPIYVLARRSGRPDARTFFEVVEGVAPEAYQASIAHPRTIDFQHRYEDGNVRRMVFLGWDVDLELGGGELAWLTFHWYAGPLDGHDYTVVYRVTDPDGRARQTNHKPTWDVHPTSTWKEGWIVRESLAVPLSADWSDFGGPHCRGDLIPARLWLQVAEYVSIDDGLTLRSSLAPVWPSGGRMEGEDGHLLSQDDLFPAGGMWLPVPARARVPDDGRRL